MRVGSVGETPGKVYLIGAGPGDPGLFTLKGKRCLEEADVVVYDYLANPRLLRYAKPGAELIYVGKQAGQHTLAQEEIGRLLVARASEIPLSSAAGRRRPRNWRPPASPSRWCPA